MFAVALNQEKVESLLEGFRAGLPKPAVALRWEYGEDWLGDPAVRVRVILPDGFVDHRSFGRFTTNLRWEISQAIRKEATGFLPYVSFRSEATDKKERRKQSKKYRESA